MAVPVILAVVAVLVILCLLPVRVGVAGRYFAGERPSGRGWLRPGYGLAGVQAGYAEGEFYIGLMVLGRVIWRFRPGGRKPSPSVEEAEKEEVEEGEAGVEEEEEALTPGERVELFKERVRMLWGYGTRLKMPLRRFAGRVYRAFRLRRASGRVVYGAGNPATTGRNFGYAMAVLSVVAGPRFQMRVAPDFERACLEGEAEVDGWVYPHRLGWSLICMFVRVGSAWAAQVWAQHKQARVAAGAGR